MAKFSGVIGFADTVEVEPGVWIPDQIIERLYRGDLIRNYKKHETSGEANDNLNIANEVSIVADSYATEHSFAMRYIKFNTPKLGGAWKVTNIEVAYPRLILTIGGVYNGEQA